MYDVQDQLQCLILFGFSFIERNITSRERRVFCTISPEVSFSCAKIGIDQSNSPS